MLAESYDNVGLLVGLPEQEATAVLVTLDVTEAVLAEAKAKGCNMIVAHHPIWFMPRKRLNGEDFVSRVIMQAIKDDIALFACHTNLDAVHTGVNNMIGQRLGVKEMRTLSPKGDVLQTLVALGSKFAVQVAHNALEMEGLDSTLLAPWDRAGGGRLEIVLPAFQKNMVMGIIQRHSSAAELSIHTVQNKEAYSMAGSGMIGSLPQPMKKVDFLAHVKERFGCGGIRYSDAALEEVQKIAWCGGAGSFLIDRALQAGAHALVTADITYHKFFENEGRMLLLDIGHFESEQFTSQLISHYLSEKFPNFAVRLSDTCTNPVKYY